MAKLPFLGLGCPYKLSDLPLLSPDDLILTGTSLQTLPRATIGNDCETRDIVTIGDAERTGKTELIKSLILQDIENGHGVFFLDPHGDAVDELIQRVPEARVNDVISLDVRDREYSFAINLLACRDISDISEREDAFTIAKKCI